VHWRDRSRRRPGINEPGHAHELTFTCFHRYQFLRAERTCLWLAESIGQARQELRFHLWAYVFMPEHVHLVVCPLQPIYDVSEVLVAIKEPVGRRAIAYLRRVRGGDNPAGERGLSGASKTQPRPPRGARRGAVASRSTHEVRS
jgi:REP element-mobilizing transposase RayT